MSVRTSPTAGDGWSSLRNSILTVEAEARADYAKLHGLEIGTQAGNAQIAGFKKRVAVVQKTKDVKALLKLSKATLHQANVLRQRAQAQKPKADLLLTDRFLMLAGKHGRLDGNDKGFEARDLAVAFPAWLMGGKTPAKAKTNATVPQGRGLKTVTAQQQHEAIQTLSTGRADVGTRHLALETLRRARRGRLERTDYRSPDARQSMLALNDRLFDTLRTALDDPGLRGVRWNPRIWNAVAHGALVRWAPNAFTTVRQGSFHGLPVYHAVLNRDLAPLVARGDAEAQGRFRTIVTRALNLNNDVYVRQSPHNVFDEILRQLGEPPHLRHLMVAALVHLSNPGRDRNHPLERWLTDFRSAVRDWRPFPDNDSLMRNMASPQDIEDWATWLDDEDPVGPRWVDALLDEAQGMVHPRQVLRDAGRPPRSGTSGGGGYHSGRPPSPGPGGGAAGAAAVVSGRQHGGRTAAKPGQMSIGALGPKPAPGLRSAPGRAAVARPQTIVHDGL